MGKRRVTPKQDSRQSECRIEEFLKKFHDIVHDVIDCPEAGFTGEAVGLIAEFNEIIRREPRRRNGAVALALARLVRQVVDSTKHGDEVAAELKAAGFQTFPSSVN
ncbi:MAG: hypothetical protein WBR26_23725 [Candidatus Acidiferrum sp.]